MSHYVVIFIKLTKLILEKYTIQQRSQSVERGSKVRRRRCSRPLTPYDKTLSKLVSWDYVGSLVNANQSHTYSALSSFLRIRLARPGHGESEVQPAPHNVTTTAIWTVVPNEIPYSYLVWLWLLLKIKSDW